MSLRVVTESGKNPWLSWSYVSDNAERIRTAVIQHLEYTAISVALAAVLGIALAVLAYRVRWLAGPILSGMGVLYTIPSLGLLAVLGPIMPEYRQAVVLALVLYALLVITRTTLTALLQVPPEVREAATGMGYGRTARLLRVELPLALPGIMIGLRLATVSTVALVTVGAIIGEGGLGSLMLEGFTANFFRAQIVTGLVLIVALGLTLDALLLLVGRLLTPWTRRRAA